MAGREILWHIHLKHSKISGSTVQAWVPSFRKEKPFPCCSPFLASVLMPLSWLHVLIPISDTKRYLWLPENIFQTISLNFKKGERFQPQRLLVIWLHSIEIFCSCFSREHTEKSREIQRKSLLTWVNNYFPVTSGNFLKSTAARKKTLRTPPLNTKPIPWAGRDDLMAWKVSRRQQLFVVGVVMRISCASPPGTLTSIFWRKIRTALPPVLPALLCCVVKAVNTACDLRLTEDLSGDNFSAVLRERHSEDS